MVPRQPEQRERLVGESFHFEGDDITNQDPRPHLKPTLAEWNDDGTRNLVVKGTPPTADEMSTSSNDTSQASADDHNTSREPTPNTDVTSVDQPDNESSLDATHGGSAHSVQSVDEVQHVWYRGDVSGQFPPTPTQVEFRLEESGHIRRRSKNRAEHPVIIHQEHGLRNVVAPATTATRIMLLVILTAVTFLNFAIAIRTIHLAHQKATTLKHTKFTLLLTTHVVAICAAFGAVVLRRPPTEALLYFVVIVLLGNMVRREAECFL